MMSPARVLLGAIGMVSLVFVGAAVSPSADEAAVQPAVRIDNFSYAPSTLVVAAGTTVTWTNDDDDVHTVIEKERKFKSAALDTHDTFVQTFTTPGEYDYFCSLHPQMVGKIVVKPAKPSS
jgi:plastocyanin